MTCTGQTTVSSKLRADKVLAIQTKVCRIVDIFKDLYERRLSKPRPLQGTTTKRMWRLHIYV